MKLYRTTKGFVIEEKGSYFLSKHNDWDVFINRPNLCFELQRELQKLTPDYDFKTFITHNLLPPLQSQEVWGILEPRTETAAVRPALFFKALPHRVVGHGQEIRMRRDSKQTVSEPKLALFVNSAGKIAGYTLANDVTARDIETENVVYLPQAKMFEGSTALGSCLVVLDEGIDENAFVRIDILRDEKLIYHQKNVFPFTKTFQKELVSYLVKEMTFEKGCFFMLGKRIDSEKEMMLQAHDEVRISNEIIGILKNTVAEKRH